MKTLTGIFAALGVLLAATDDAALPHDGSDFTPHFTASNDKDALLSDNDLVQQYCVACHNDRRLRGNMSLEGFNAERPEDNGALAEAMIVKLRAGMMPPPGVRRPSGDALQVLAASLEERIDAAAVRDPNPGGRTFQRLNQIEYERSIEDLLGLDIDGSQFLPLDTKSANFDLSLIHI